MAMVVAFEALRTLELRHELMCYVMTTVYIEAMINVVVRCIFVLHKDYDGLMLRNLIFLWFFVLPIKGYSLDDCTISFQIICLFETFDDFAVCHVR